MGTAYLSNRIRHDIHFLVKLPLTKSKEILTAGNLDDVTLDL